MSTAPNALSSSDKNSIIGQLNSFMFSNQHQPENPEHSAGPSEANRGAGLEGSRIVPAAQLRDTRRHLDKPVLTYEELRSISSWAELKALYQSKGESFSSDQHYLDRVKADWKLIQTA